MDIKDLVILVVFVVFVLPSLISLMAFTLRSTTSPPEKVAEEGEKLKINEEILSGMIRNINENGIKKGQTASDIVENATEEYILKKSSGL